MKSPNVAVIFFAQNSLSHMSHPFGFSLSIWVCVSLSLFLSECVFLSGMRAQRQYLLQLLIESQSRVIEAKNVGKKQKSTIVVGIARPILRHIRRRNQESWKQKTNTHSLTHTRAFINRTYTSTFSHSHAITHTPTGTTRV